MRTVADKSGVQKPRAMAWLVLFALVSVQFAVAGHQSAHAAGEPADTCAFCLKLDDTGQALASVAGSPLTVADRVTAIDFDATPATRQGQYRPPPRAPPSA